MAKNILVSWLNNIKSNTLNLPNNPLGKLEEIGKKLNQSTTTPMNKAPVAQVKKTGVQSPQYMSVPPKTTIKPMSIDQRPMSMPNTSQSSKVITPAPQPISRFLGFQEGFVNPLDRLKTQVDETKAIQSKKPLLNLQGNGWKREENNKTIRENGVAILKQYKAVGDLVADTYKGGVMDDAEIIRLYPEFGDKIKSARGVINEVYESMQNGGTPDFIGMKTRYPDLFNANQKELPYKNLKTKEEYKKIDEESKKIWNKMSDINTEVLSNNGKEYRNLMYTLQTIPGEIRSRYRIPHEISDTELTTFAVGQDPELKAEYERITKLRLSDVDQAMLGIGGNWMNKLSAGIQKGVNKADSWAKKLSEDFREVAAKMKKEGGLWTPVASLTQGVLNTVQGVSNGLNNTFTSIGKLANKDYENAGEMTNDTINLVGGAGETVLTAGFPIVTTAFNSASETKTGEKVLSNSVGLIPEGINNILANTPGVQDWYNNLDESGQAYVTNGLTMAVLHKANTATKNTQKNVKIYLGVVNDAVTNAVQRGWNASKFQAWVEKGLKNAETGKYQKGALGRVIKEGVTETKGALKENFGKFDEVLNARRQSVTNLTDQRGVWTKAKNDHIKPDIEQVKASVKNTTNQIVGGIKNANVKTIEIAGKGINILKKTGGNIAESSKNGLSKIKAGVSKVPNIGDAVSKTADILSKPFDKGADVIAQKITGTSSAQDKLFKAQNPSLNRLGRKDKSYEQKRERADRANELIVERGHIPTNAEERMRAHKETMDALWEEHIGKGIAEKANVKVSSSEIADAMEAEIAHLKQGPILSVHKNDLKRVEKDILDLRKRGEITIAEAENLKQQINMAIDRNNSPTAGEVYQKALRGATKKIGEIEDRIISEIPGEFSQFKKDWGALKDGMEDIIKAHLKELKRNGDPIMETYGKLEGLGDIITALTSGKPANIATGLGKITLGKAYGRAKNVDFLIKNGFKQLAKELEGGKGKIGKGDGPQVPLAPKKPKNILGDTIAKNAGQEIQKRSGGNVSNSTPNEETISKKNKIERAPILGLKKTRKTGNGEKSKGKGKKILGLPDKSQVTKKSDFKPLSNFSLENKKGFAEDEEKSLGDARIYTKAKKSDFEVLPSDVDVLEEAKKLGPKRIAPDRRDHQQLDPQSAMEKLAEAEKKLCESKIENLQQDLEKYRSIMKKYDGKLPARTEKNRAKYPDLIREYGEIQQLKKQYLLAGEITKSQNIEQTIEGMIEFNKRRIENITPERMKERYIELVQQDLSKGYKYPEAVLNFVPEARKILNGRERYEKGLHTSFSAKDERINYDYKEEIGSGMKRQDGKQLTQEQKEDIVEGVKDFGNILRIDMKKLGEEKKWVYVHLNGKNVFLKNGVGGLYREKGENISISVGGIETVRQTLGGEVSAVKVHTVMSHELGHALDAIQNWKLFPSGKLFDLKIRMNKAPTSNARYWKSDAEITARAIEQHIAIKKGNTAYYDKPAYWKQEVYEHIIEPMVKEAIEAKFGGYMKGKIQSGKPLPKSSQDRESAMIWFSEKTSKKITDLTKQYPAEGKNELEKLGKLNSQIPKSSGKRSEKDKAIYRVKDDILLDDIIEKGLTIKDEGEQTTYTLEQDGVYVTWHLGDRVRRILKQKGLLK